MEPSFRSVTLVAALLAAECGTRPSFEHVVVPPNESYDVSSTHLADGLEYVSMSSKADTQQVRVVVADLRKSVLLLAAETSNDSLLGFERTSEMFRRLSAGGEKPLVAINADFWHRDGAPVGMFVDDGQIWRGPWYGSGVDSGATRSIFAFDSNNEVAIGLPEYRLTLTVPDGSALEIRDVNLSESDQASRVFTDRYPFEIQMLDGLEYFSFSRVDQPWLPNVPIRLSFEGPFERSRRLGQGEVVLALPGSEATAVARQPQGEFRLAAELANLAGPVDGVVGGLPRLIDGSGDSVIVDPLRFAVEEGIRRNFVTDRHPRTAVGWDRDLDWLYLVVVDGRSESAVGIDLVTLAQLFREWGCDLALNLDGGGSTTMVIMGEVVNRPSDREGERPVSNVLLVRAR